MTRPAWRQAPPMALPSASLRAASASAGSMPSFSQPASKAAAQTAVTVKRRFMAGISAGEAPNLSGPLLRHGEQPLDPLLGRRVGAEQVLQSAARQRIHDHH